MTDRINSFLVVLKADQRADDAESLKVALLQLRGVLSVTANISDSSIHVAEQRAVYKIGDAVLAAMNPWRNP